MKLLFMNSARTWGGTEKWTKLASETIRKDREHETFLAYRRDTIGRRFSMQKFRLPCTSHIDLYTLFRLVLIIRREKIDVIIPTKRKDYLIAGIAARFCGIACILRLGIERRLRVPFFHRLIYHILPHGIIVNADKIRQSLLLSPFMKRERIKVIHNGVDTLNIDMLARVPVQKPFQWLVVSAGILTDRKGFDFLLRGFAMFARNHPSADPGLVIMGEGPKKEELRKLAEELGIGKRTVFTGFIENPYPCMAAADVIAMTSQNEGIANALLEGMYLGNVPVSTFAGGSEELVRNGRNGFLVEFGNTEKLAEIFHELFENRECRKNMASAARETILSSYSLDTMRQEILDFCTTIIESER
jgi:glycosyltransferase involved in cell wall biosynthesis